MKKNHSLIIALCCFAYIAKSSDTQPTLQAAIYEQKSVFLTFHGITKTETIFETIKPDTKPVVYSSCLKENFDQSCRTYQTKMLKGFAYSDNTVQMYPGLPRFDGLQVRKLPDFPGDYLALKRSPE